MEAVKRLPSVPLLDSSVNLSTRTALIDSFTKINALAEVANDLSVAPPKHADQHASDGDDAITPANIGALGTDATPDDIGAAASTHASQHATTGNDPLSASDIGAAAANHTHAAAAGTVLQTVHGQSGSVATGTTQIPFDDTVPQNTEGSEAMSLTITPASATNKLLITVTLNVASTNPSLHVTAALFQGTTADAIAAHTQSIGVANMIYQIQFTCLVTAGTTEATTYAVRVGPSASATVTVNGNSGARYLGGVLLSTMTIMEIQG